MLERDGRVCRMPVHEPGCEGVATEVDHIGDRDDHGENNLRATSRTCHRSRTGRQARAARGIHATRRPPQPHPGLID